MSLISINLLPEEFIVEQTKKLKFVKIQSISIAILLLTFFLASLTIALRVLQSQRINQVQGKLTEIESQISGYKTVEDNVVLLKKRIGSINQYLGVSSKGALIYEFVEKNIPSRIIINSLTIDKSGDVFLTLVLPDSISLDAIVNGLLEAQTEKVKIKEISLDGLSRGRDGTYRLSLKLKNG